MWLSTARNIINAVVNGVLAVHTSKSRFTGASVSIYLIHTQTVVLTRIAGTVINIQITVSSRPARLTDTLISKQLVNAHASNTWLIGTQINLLFTTLAVKSIGTVTLEVIDEISAVAAKQTGLFKAVINVVLTKGSLPSISALTVKPALG